MKKFFTGCKTLDELRNEYRKALKQYHPDNGGDGETIKQVNVDYDAAFQRLKNSRQHYKEDWKEENENKKWSDINDAAIREKIEKIIHYDINIEIVGSWIWVDGNTIPVKDILKENGYQWSRNRKKWHYTPDEQKKHYGKKYSFDEIRNKYGSENVNTEKQATLS